VLLSFPQPYGRYILEKRIAMGGMAEIFLARTNTEGFNKQVCIKRVLPHFLESKDFITMFRDEAALAAKLQHGNVVQVFDFGQEEDTLYLAMEYIDGADLRQLQKMSIRQNCPLRIEQILQIGIALCRGLHHAHTRQENGRPLSIVHRDVSPHNVLVSKAGEVKLTDFGIAKAAERATHTSTGVVKGKIAYMAPEQLEGAVLDHRVDQFAAAIVLWELCTDRQLFNGENEASILRQVIMCEVPNPSTIRADLPTAISAILLKALSASPDNRFSNMRELEQELTRILFDMTTDPASADLESWAAGILAPQEAARKTAVLPSPPDLKAEDKNSAGSDRLSHAGEDQDQGVSSIFTRNHASMGAGAAAKANADTLERNDDDKTILDTHVSLSGWDSSAHQGSSPLPGSRDATSPTGTARNIDLSDLQAQALDGESASSTAAAKPVPADPAIGRHPAGQNEVSSTERIRDRKAKSNRSFLTAAILVILGLSGSLAYSLVGLPDPGSNLPLPTAEPIPPRAAIQQPKSNPPPSSTQDQDSVHSSTQATGPKRKELQNATEKRPSRGEESIAKQASAIQNEGATKETLNPAPDRASKKKMDTKRKSKMKTKKRAQPAAAQAKGRIFVDVPDSWAVVYAGKKRLGETPLQITYPAGKHTLRLVNPESNKSTSVTVVVIADKLVQSIVRLKD
jgi:serine/threonine protein kinase